MKFETYDVQLPSWSLSYIFNCDPSGLDDKEIADIDDYLKLMPTHGHFSIPDSEPYFSHTNDIRPWEGGDIVDVKYNHNIQD